MEKDNKPEPPAFVGQLDEILYQFSRYCRHHERTARGGEGIIQPEAHAQLIAAFEAHVKACKPEMLGVTNSKDQYPDSFNHGVADFERRLLENLHV